MPRVWKRKEHQQDRSRPWMVTWTDRERDPATGLWHAHQRTFTGTADKAESLSAGKAREDRARRLMLGVPRPDDALANPASTPTATDTSIATALRRWRMDLEGCSPAYVRESIRILRQIAAPHTQLAELTAETLMDHVADLRKQGLSARTIEKHRSRARSFMAFVTEGLNLLERNPWAGVSARRTRDRKRARRQGADTRYQRRELTEEEIPRLLNAARAGDTWRSGSPKESKKGTRRWKTYTQKPQRNHLVLTGPDRWMIYRLALEAGLRLGDIARLCPEHVRRDPPAGPSLLLPCPKSQDPTVHPITATLAADLAALAADRPMGRPIWRLPSSMAQVLRVDLAAATPPIPAHHTDDHAPGSPEARGKAIRDVVDFHSLRVTFVTRAAGNPAITARQLQAIARHASITTTMEHYARLPDRQAAAAMNAVPPLPT